MVIKLFILNPSYEGSLSKPEGGSNTKYNNYLFLAKSPFKVHPLFILAIEPRKLAKQCSEATAFL